VRAVPPVFGKRALSVTGSVTPAPLSAPRSDGVTTSTAYGPRSTPLPAASTVRTRTRRSPASSDAGTIAVRARSGHGFASRGLHAGASAPTTRGAPVTSISSTRRIPALSVALSTTGSEPARGPPASRPSAVTLGFGGWTSETVTEAP
jgi:hypothetical protein